MKPLKNFKYLVKSISNELAKKKRFYGNFVQNVTIEFYRNSAVCGTLCGKTRNSLPKNFFFFRQIILE